MYITCGTRTLGIYPNKSRSDANYAGFKYWHCKRSHQRLIWLGPLFMILHTGRRKRDN